MWDYDKIGLNDFEGMLHLPVAAVSSKPNEPQDMWIPLLDKKMHADKNR